MFNVDEKLTARLRNKYKKINTAVVEVSSGPDKILVQSRIAIELLKISEEETKSYFSSLCISFLEICKNYQIPFKPIHVLILTDDDLDRGLQIDGQNVDDGSIWGYIYIPPSLFKVSAFWNYTFLHELGHCWINVQFEDLETKEIFTDLVAICALKKIIPSHKRIYRDVIKHATYVGNKAGQQFFGKRIQKTILKNPESYLRKSIKLMREVNEHKLSNGAF